MTAQVRGQPAHIAMTAIVGASILSHSVVAQTGGSNTESLQNFAQPELKENVVTLSQSVLQQVSQLSFRLRHASFAKEPDAIAIRQDIDRLNQLSESLVEPKLSEAVVIDANVVERRL
jgi:hypothetical protein